MISNKAIVQSFINAKLKRKCEVSLHEIEKDIIHILLIESEKIEREYSNVFDTFTSLLVDLPPDEECLPTILTHLLEEKSLCWGRIVVTFTYAGYLTSKYLNDINNTKINYIIDILGQFLDKKASSWIENVGGWRNFIWHVKKDYKTINSIVKFLVVTIIIYISKTFFVKLFF